MKLKNTIFIEVAFARVFFYNLCLYFKLVLAFVLISGGLAKAVAKDLNEQLVLAINNEVDTLHPYLTHLILGHFVTNFSYHPLVYLDAKGKYQPLIAQKIPNFKDHSLRRIKNNKNYELEASWQLKEQLKWGDGERITCEDIKFAMEVALNEHVSTPVKKSFTNIYEIVVDEKNQSKCLIKYKKAKIDFFVETPSPLPRHLEKTIYEKYKNEDFGYERNTLYNTNITNPGLWSGPYLITENKLGSHIVLTRNENFYGEKAKIKKIIIKVFKDSGTLEANLNSKNIDMTTRFGLSIDQAQAIEAKLLSEKNPSRKVLYQESNTFLHLAINTSHRILSDINIRKAMELAINKSDLVTHLLHDKAKIADHFKLKNPMTSSVEENKSDDSSKSIERDRKKKARQLLDSLGWKVAKDNFRYKDNKKLSFQITTSGGNKINETIVAFIQDQLKEIGIELSVRLETLKFLFSEKLPKGDFDLAFFSFTFLPEYSWREVFNSQSIPDAENMWSGYNFSRFKNSQADKIISKLDSTLQEKDRDKLFLELIKIYKTEIPSIPLYFRYDNSVIPINLKNYSLNPYGPFESIHANLWEFHSQ